MSLERSSSRRINQSSPALIVWPDGGHCAAGFIWGDKAIPDRRSNNDRRKRSGTIEDREEKP